MRRSGDLAAGRGYHRPMTPSRDAGPGSQAKRAPDDRHTNRLAGETSPYLLQHAHNPVDWYPWGPEALARAKAEDRPIFLSIGYAACHWCHVMERESFENEATAAQLNRDFVPIKVDREERPDLDQVYMAAVQAMTGGGGWPMSVFLTPDGRPFYGGTYFPDVARHGLPAFREVLSGVADAWRTRRDELETSGSRLVESLTSHEHLPIAERGPDAALLDRAVATLERSFDARNGGWGGAPKFPQSMTLEFLLRRWVEAGDARAIAMARRTLDRMADGGIHDQLGGGFHRYATDADLARAALREDALRQRAAGPRLPARVPGDRRAALSRRRARHPGLHAARPPAGRRHLRRQPRRRHRRRRGLDVRLVRPGDRGDPGCGWAALRRRVRGHDRRQLGGPDDPLPGSRRCGARGGVRPARGGGLAKAGAGARRALRGPQPSSAAGSRRQGAGVVERAGDRGLCRGRARRDR